MGRQQLRIRLSQSGLLEVVDPGFDCLDLLQAVNPEFRIRSQELLCGTKPKFLEARLMRVGCSQDAMRRMSIDALIDLHAQVMNGLLFVDGGASLLDLKIEITGRYIQNCVLCGHRCRVDRTRKEKGVCGLGREATVAEHFVHIAEESPINPSLLVSLAGCGLRCHYCQQWKLLSPPQISGPALGPALWRNLATEGARTISFAGGNPDESLFAVLRFLKSAPDHWDLPVVWNNHAYCSPETLELLDGIVDVYLPDFKYGSDDCGRRWSGIHGYPEVARRAIRRMLDRNVPVIVRILVLPGHVNCCHIPVLRCLVEMATTNLKLSIRGQYCPDWEISEADGSMSTRPEPREVKLVQTEASSLGLALLDEEERYESKLGRDNL